MLKSLQFGAIGLLLVFAGCATAPVQKVASRSELVYKKVLVLPFIGDATDQEHTLAYSTFVLGLSALQPMTIVSKEKLDNDWQGMLGLPTTSSYTSLDFLGPEKRERREKLVEQFGVDGIIFGELIRADKELLLIIQMVRIEEGELILSFSRQEHVISEDATEPIKSLSQKAAQKTIEFLQDNVLITNIYRN